ncbi:IS66 family insertion sequence element accessory protein TnpB [Nitrosomonas sp. ANs5]|uniref:IS66 family insertion sequence element accessory protein TnpB n=1 Tax=Nitrosomonas sp. ANs5 TaxID=3423941 RepID=UPI003D338947
MVADPVDMRQGIDGLSLLVQQTLGHSPCAGSAFVFCNRAGRQPLSEHPLRRPAVYLGNFGKPG